MVNVTSTASLFLMYLILLANSIAIKVPSIIHHKTILTNIHNHSPNVVAVSDDHDCIIVKTIKKSATDVPSLNNDSHSMRRLRRRGTQSCLKILKTATGSVAETIIPNKISTDTGTSRPHRPKIRYPNHAMIAIDRHSPTVAINRIVVLFLISWW